MQTHEKRSFEELREELKELLVLNLALEDLSPGEIADDESLFGDRILPSYCLCSVDGGWPW